MLADGLLNSDFKTRKIEIYQETDFISSIIERKGRLVAESLHYSALMHESKPSEYAFSSQYLVQNLFWEFFWAN